MKAILLLAVLAVAWLTLTPNPVALPPGEYDKLAHLGAFFALALLADLAWPQQRIGWWAITLLCLYGGATEVAQHFVPNRSMSLLDFVADSAGVLLYAGLLSPHVDPIRESVTC